MVNRLSPGGATRGLRVALPALLVLTLAVPGCGGGRSTARWRPGDAPAAGADESPEPLPSATAGVTLAPPTGEVLVTNEYATYHGGQDAVTSPDWVANSGSLFAREGVFWSGKPDSCAPDLRSVRCTNSNVFRMNSRRTFAGRTTVSLAVRQNRRLLDGGCAKAGTCWRWVHVWLRYQSETNLYYASVQRADGTVVIKRKVPCGSDNDGTYLELSRFVPHGFVVGQWRHYAVSIETMADDSVRIRLFDTDTDPTRPVVTGTDRGGTNPRWSKGCSVGGAYPSAQYPPIREAGSIGVRGDFADFSFSAVAVGGAAKGSPVPGVTGAGRPPSGRAPRGSLIGCVVSRGSRRLRLGHREPGEQEPGVVAPEADGSRPRDRGTADPGVGPGREHGAVPGQHDRDRTVGVGCDLD
jgi:hypothetical protein